MKKRTRYPWGNVDRRKDGDRRSSTDRRSQEERRYDTRLGDGDQRRSIRVWLRSMTNARLGVDRRKGDRRQQGDRRNQFPQDLLTKQEIADLLSL